MPYVQDTSHQQTTWPESALHVKAHHGIPILEKSHKSTSLMFHASRLSTPILPSTTPQSHMEMLHRFKIASYKTPSHTSLAFSIHTNPPRYEINTKIKTRPSRYPLKSNIPQ
jgi:hypothetical protein